jgi:hypothetical protein
MRRTKRWTAERTSKGCFTHGAKAVCRSTSNRLGAYHQRDRSYPNRNRKESSEVNGSQPSFEASIQASNSLSRSKPIPKKIKHLEANPNWQKYGCLRRDLNRRRKRWTSEILLRGSSKAQKKLRNSEGCSGSDVGIK